jgi:hypothetical protein
MCKHAFMECVDPNPGGTAKATTTGRVDDEISPECLDLITNSDWVGDGFCDRDEEGYNTEGMCTILHDSIYKAA